MTIQNIFLSGAIIGCLSGCNVIGDTETAILGHAGIHDAHQVSQEVQLAYLQCYGLQNADKETCHYHINLTLPKRRNARNWEYIRPFERETERLGFLAFLHDKGRACQAIKDEPVYYAEQNVYEVHCTDGNVHHMHFDRAEQTWNLAHE